MQHDRDLQFCMDALRSLQIRDGLEPEQRSAVEKAKERLRRLRRKSNPSRREIFEAVRRVVEAITQDFVV
jgi:hypothetical protein